MSDHEVRTILDYCNNNSTLKEQTIIITLLHTGIRAAELAALQVTDIVQVQGKWKLHIHEGKGLKDRVIPLTAQCLAMLQAWQANGWEQANNFSVHPLWSSLAWRFPYLSGGSRVGP
ncbi:MAG: tyrosine-type recombinase/integrase [Caldilineaceae bacterium]